MIFELPLILSYIYNKKNSKTANLFTTLSRECVGLKYYLYKRKDNVQLFDDLIQKGSLNIWNQCQIIKCFID